MSTEGEISARETIKRFYREILQLSGTQGIDKPLKKAVIAYLEGFGNLSPKQMEEKVENPLRIIRSVSNQIGLGTSTIVSLIIYELIREKKYSLDHVKREYNKEVYHLTEGLVLAHSIDYSNIGKQSELFVNLLLSLSKDIRVILCLLAESYSSIVSEEIKTDQSEIEKSYYLYVPIAQKLGYHKISRDIENAYLRMHNPDVYSAIEKRIRKAQLESSDEVSEFLAPIERELKTRGIKFITKWRTKSVYSIYKKMQAKNVSLDEVYDILAVRIIITGQKRDEKGDCWEVYSVVTNLYPPNTERFRDWISEPKITGYESLHTTVQNTSGQWIEVQIRTKRMDEIAELGIAAHWKYKSGEDSSETNKLLTGIRNALENKQFAQPAHKLIKSTSLYCFTPNGDLIKLPTGSTIIDFAYHVHTQVGDQCFAAKVNGKNVQLKHKLLNGDQVEIVTSKNQTPKQDWLQIARSPRAKSKIKKFLVEKDLQDAGIGREYLLRKLKNWKIDYRDEIIGVLIKHFKLKNSVELYSSIANEKISFEKIKSIVAQKNGEEKSVKEDTPTIKDTALKPVPDDILIIDNELSAVNYRLAKCCNPMLGDRISGFITIGKGITIHKKDCPNLHYLYKKISLSANECKMERQLKKIFFFGNN